MGYTETLFNFALKGACPGCGTQMLADVSPTVIAPSVALYKFCICCGWIAYAEKDGKGNYDNIQFSSMPPDVDSLDRFNCALAHPEHRDNWPQPERDDSQPDKLSSVEILQELLRVDGKHVYLGSPEEICGNCRAWASHKITEERPNFYGHPFTSALCCDCFEKIFGPAAHKYTKVYAPVVIGDI